MLLNPALFNRSRTTDNLVLGTSTRQIYSGPGCQITTSTASGSRTGSLKIIQDVNTPGFKGKSVKGQIVNSPVDIVTSAFTSSGGSYEHIISAPFVCATDTGFYRDVRSNLMNAVAGPLQLEPTYGLASEDLIQRAATAALADVKAPLVLGGAIVLELNKTLSSIKHPLSSLRKTLARHGPLVKDLNRVEFLKKKQLSGRVLKPHEKDFLLNHPASIAGNGKGIASELSSQYLELIFGIMPTMRDIGGIVEALVETTSTRATARGSYSATSSSSDTSVYFRGSALLTASKKVDVVEELKVRVGILYDVSSENTASRLGLGSTTLLPTLWEVVPWSFVVDWFSNTGEVITAYKNSLNQSFLAQWVSITRKQVIDRTAVGETLAPGWNLVKACDSHDVATFEHYQRYPINAPDYIRLKANIAFDRVNVGASIALTIQQLTKR